MNKILFFIWIGTGGLWGIIREQHSPCDKSNRINKVILYWMVFTSHQKILKFQQFKGLSQWELIKLATRNEEVFVRAMPWLKLDLWEMLMKPGRFKQNG